MINMNQIKTSAGDEIYSNSEADRLSEHYGLDVADELSKMLSEQLAKEIDKDILKGLGIEPDRNKRRRNSIDKIFKSSE
jgi:hypothetical protein